MHFTTGTQSQRRPLNVTTGKSAIMLTFDSHCKFLKGYSEIHQKVFKYVYLQFKSGFKENYLALTLKITLYYSRIF